MISFRLNKQKNKLFKEKTEVRWPYPLALFLALSLMIWDKVYPIVPLHQVLSSLVYPFHYTVNAPRKVFDWGRLVWGSKQALLNENHILYQEQLQLKADLQQFLMLQDENASLRALLALSKRAPNKTLAAEVLALETTRSKQLIIINKGKKDGVETGQLVIDTEGVTGQVIETGVLTSTVLLISDAASAVPVRNQRTHETAILIGTNELNHLSLLHLPKTAAVREGDVLVTSGLGQRYPAGYPVGVVKQVEMPPGEAFIQVDVKPFTHYYKNRLVLLVWPGEKKQVESKT